MPNFFCHYWTKATYLHQQTKQSFVGHTASNQFRKAGVGPGDYVYIWSYFDDTLWLLGSMQVDHVASQKAAQRILGNTDLWTAGDHLITDNPEPEHFGLKVPKSKVSKIKFITASGKITGIKYFDDGTVNWQTFRGVRQITEETALKLDEVLASIPAGKTKTYCYTFCLCADLTAKDLADAQAQAAELFAKFTKKRKQAASMLGVKEVTLAHWKASVMEDDSGEHGIYTD